MSNLINNPLVYLFEEFSNRTGVELNSFVLNETPNNTFHNQKFMQQYANNTNNGDVYKYLYDPGLSFSWRFHQRLARIKYTDRKEPWITLMFNTGTKEPLTTLGSLNYTHYEQYGNNKLSIVDVKRNVMPVDIVFISNSIDYLYNFLGKLNFWFDRSTGIYYNQSVAFSNSHVVEYELASDVFNIKTRDLNKLDTERRGSLVSAGYSFDMGYWELNLPEEGYIVENINLKIKVVDNINNSSMTLTTI